MKIVLRAPKFVLGIVPVLATATIAALPSQAATLSLADTQLSFSNFSGTLNPGSINTFSNTDTPTVAVQGVVTADANATAGFGGTPPQPSNFANGVVRGDGVEYTGTAFAEAALQGQYAVQKTLSFDFEALFRLATAVDDSTTETATSSGSLFFQLFDTTNANKPILLDTFSIVGLLNSSGNNDFLDSEISPYIKLSSTSSFEKAFGGNQEFVDISVKGTYNRIFNEPVLITLTEGKSIEANASAVPEPFTVLGTVLVGVGGAALKRRQASASRRM